MCDTLWYQISQCVWSFQGNWTFSGCMTEAVFLWLMTITMCFRFWFFKFAALVAITVCAFYIPEGPFTYSKNLYLKQCATQIITHFIQRAVSVWKINYSYLVVAVWFVIGSGGAFFFILIQLVLLVDFAHSWNESWVDKMENGNSKGWYAGQSLWSSCMIYSPS